MPFRTAISGLNAASNDLNVTANNIANANTTGFKQSRAEFADVYAVGNLGSSANAIGAGVTTSRVSQEFTQGTIQFTEKSLDLAINGQGFFILDDGGTQKYTRNGAFGLDRNGFMTTGDGKQLITFQADTSGNITGATGPLQIDTSDQAPTATAAVDLTVNLDAAATAIPGATVFNANDPTTFNNSTSTTVFDSLGNQHLASFFFRKDAANDWLQFTQIDGVDVTATAGGDSLTFNSAGALTVPAGGSLNTASFTLPGATAATLSLNFAGTTQFGSAFGVSTLRQDGFATGRISGLDIDDNGVVFARFTNGQSRVQGQVAMANFSSPEGLQPLGGTAWAETFGSGLALIGAPNTSTFGVIQAGALEDSNVELSEQLVNMIVAQRNFQANAEMISTVDQVTQSIINIR